MHLVTAALKTSLPPRGTKPYAILHAQQIASHWDIQVQVVRRGEIYLCLVEGMALDGGELVGKAAAGGRMFVYHGASAARVAPVASRCAG
jgi:hypothetical protein